MSIKVNVQFALPKQGLPSAASIRRWASDALSFDKAIGNAELTVRMVDEAEGAELNSTYRQRNGATNILSFPFEQPALPARQTYLGDLVICAPVVVHEAAEQDKAVIAHCAHLVVHGCLHLLGHDHMDAGEAEIMEALEVRIMSSMGYSNPYPETT